jgi:hypothetical protein
VRDTQFNGEPEDGNFAQIVRKFGNKDNKEKKQGNFALNKTFFWKYNRRPSCTLLEYDLAIQQTYKVSISRQEVIWIFDNLG